MSTHTLALGSLVAALLALAGPAVATTYYVATDGDDSHPGTQALPFRTVHHGASALVPGDTLLVKAGTYAESFYDVIPGGTSWAVPVTVAAVPGDAVILQPGSGVGSVFYFAAPASQFIVISGFVIDGSNVVHDAIKIGGSGRNPAKAAHDIRFENCEVRHAPANGILVADHANNNQFSRLNVHHNGVDRLTHGFYIATSGNVVEHSDIHDNSGEGVQIFNQKPSEPVDKNVVRHNRSHDNGWAGTGCGMILSSGSGNLSYNNLVWNNRCGIFTDYGAVNSGIYNNTVYANRGIGIQAGSRSSGASIVNNIVYQNTGTAIVVKGRGNKASNNLTANPLFVDAGVFDFHLMQGSPAIDAGLPLAQVPDDHDGVARPQGAGYDIGAYEAVVP